MTNGSPDQPQPTQQENHPNSLQIEPIEQATSVPQLTAEKRRVAIESIVGEFHSVGGIQIIHKGEYLWLAPVPPAPNIPEAEMISKWEETNGTTLTELLAQGFTRERAVAEMKNDVASEGVWGLTITDRTIEQMADLVPPLESLLFQEHGKIVILGNGFSTLPVTLAEMRRSSQLGEQPVIVDLVDYRKTYDDLILLQQKFSNAGVEFPFESQLVNVIKIVAALETGDVTAVQYKIGSGNPPTELMDASLAINVMGPMANTLAEQLAVLRLGGKLLINEDARKLPVSVDFDLQTFASKDGKETGSLITRKI